MNHVERKIVFGTYRNSERSDQHTHLHSLIFAILERSFVDYFVSLKHQMVMATHHWREKKHAQVRSTKGYFLLIVSSFKY